MDKNEFEGYIEMVSGSNVKHVFDESLGRLVVHRKTALPLPHPFNYGFIKGTKSPDGDPLDVFVLSTKQKEPGSSVTLRPIGMLYVEDEMGQDNKVIAVDIGDETVAELKDISDMGEESIASLIYLLEHNKDGLEGRWTKVHGKAGKAEAIDEIHKSAAGEE